MVPSELTTQCPPSRSAAVTRIRVGRVKPTWFSYILRQIQASNHGRQPAARSLETLEPAKDQIRAPSHADVEPHPDTVRYEDARFPRSGRLLPEEDNPASVRCDGSRWNLAARTSPPSGRVRDLARSASRRRAFEPQPSGPSFTPTAEAPTTRRSLPTQANGQTPKFLRSISPYHGFGEPFQDPD